MALKKVTEIPSIDVVMVTVIDEDDVAADEYVLDTASKIGVSPQIETQDAVRLIIKGILKAQKPEKRTLTGHEIILTDNVFAPELVSLLQGGTITYDATDTDKIIGYTPPVIGSSDDGKTFTLNAYTAQYNAAGQIVQYEKIAYPHCKGTPIALNSEDNVFRAPEYKILSTPNTGEAPYDITYVDALPAI
jgi:hypothetical protein